MDSLKSFVDTFRDVIYLLCTGATSGFVLLMFINVFQQEVTRQNPLQVLNYLIIILIVMMAICALSGITLSTPTKQTKLRFHLNSFFPRILTSIVKMMLYLVGLTLVTVIMNAVLMSVSDFVTRICMLITFYVLLDYVQEIAEHHVVNKELTL